jgi:hypothetical protein
MVILDSLPCAGDVDQTLLPCSPTSMMHSDVAAKTLAAVDAHEATTVSMEGTVSTEKVWCLKMHGWAFQTSWYHTRFF